MFKKGQGNVADTIQQLQAGKASSQLRWMEPSSQQATSASWQVLRAGMGC
jgi:hypothetical protein